MKLKNTSIYLFGAIVIVVAALVAISSGSLAQDTGISASAAAVPSPAAGPTAYVPGGSATAAPSITVVTRTVSTPSATPAPTPTPTPVPATAPVTGSSGTSAQLVNYGTDKDTFNRGEQATGFMTIKNTGNTVINDVTTSISASRAVPVIGETTLGSKDYTFNNLNINPGETKRVEFKADIPSEYKGVSTAGDYTLHITVRTGGSEIGSFSKNVKIA